MPSMAFAVRRLPPAAAPVPATPVKPAVAPAAAAPPSGAFVAPKPGTKLIMSTGGGLQVTGVAGRTVSVSSLRGEPEPPMVGLFFRPGPQAVFDRAAIEGIWPLEVGKRVKTTVKAAGGAFELTLHVVRSETVEVPAGRFPCFLVDVEIERNHGRWIGRFHEWYAPTVGFIVRHRLEMVAGERPAVLHDWDLAGIVKP
jgi:hypothetical protein